MNSLGNGNAELIKSLDAKLKEFLDDLRKEILETIDAYLEKMENAYDLDKIRWEKAEGFKGEYERSADVNNPHFKALYKDLVRHNGKMVKDGYFIWLFKNGTTIGRKRRG